MSTDTASPEQKARVDVYALVTDKIIEQLNKGTVPWQKPWVGAGAPRNLISGHHYSGINALLLGMEGYDENLFLTFEQVKGIAGKVRKGSKGHLIVKWHKPKEEEQQTEAENGAEKKKGFLRYYTVFNIAQCDNIPERFLPTNRPTTEIPSCEAIISGMPNCPKIQHKEPQAYYHVVDDYVNMPKKKNFKSDAAYYSVQFHELVHSTGHSNRLAREGLMEMGKFGDPVYSLEELVAEIGTCYLQSLVGITGEFKNSAAYIKGWLGKLQNDKRLVFTAAKEAQKAVDYILNIGAHADDGVMEEA